MANLKRAAALLGTPLLAGGMVFGAAAPAHADGPIEGISDSYAFDKPGGGSAVCQLRLTATTDYQNVSTQDFATADLVAGPTTPLSDCTNATGELIITWVDPTGHAHVARP